LELMAEQTDATVLVNGQVVAFQAYHIGGNNFFRLRDIAYVLNGTSAQFNVGWDSENNAIVLISGDAYEIAGGELEIADDAGSAVVAPTIAAVIKKDNEVNFTAYHIAGNNFFLLRDLGESLGFNVDWDDRANAILITTER